MSSHYPLPIGVTMGDAAGIGPEIIAKMFASTLPQPALVYGDAGVLSSTLQRLKLDDKLRIELVSEPEMARYGPDIIPVLNRWQALPEELIPGQPSKLAGRGA